MAWPLSQDYNEAIQDPASAFSEFDLKAGHPVVNALGIPMPRSGNFADVYEFQGARGSRWAVKCFTRQVPGLQERYREISRHLLQAKLPFTVDFTYLEQGIRVRGQWYPILKMHWVDGFLLNEFVRGNLDKPALLDALGHIWLRMAKRMREADIAHGDLQHGNVILVSGSRVSALAVKLIDYDGMVVPGLARRPSGEVGHPAYQHPQRLQQSIYNFDLDRAPLLTIACALRALAVGGQALWQRYDNGDNLLFRESDLRLPSKSPLFHELWNLPDAAVHDLVGYLTLGLMGPLEYVPLVQAVVMDNQTRPLNAHQEQQVTAVLGAGARVSRAGVVKRVSAALPTAIPLPAGTVAAREQPAPVRAEDMAPLRFNFHGSEHRTPAKPGPRRAKYGSNKGTLITLGFVALVASVAAFLAFGQGDEAEPSGHRDLDPARGKAPPLLVKGPDLNPAPPQSRVKPEDKPFQEPEKKPGNETKKKPETLPRAGPEKKPRDQTKKKAEKTPQKEPVEKPNKKPPREQDKAAIVKLPPKEKIRTTLGKAPVPPVAEQEAATNRVKKQFAQDYEKNKPEDRLVLAAKLHKAAISAKMPTERYVQLHESSTLAAKGGDLIGALATIDSMSREFAVNALELKVAAVQNATKAISVPQAGQTLIGPILALADEAVAVDNFTAARQLIQHGKACAGPKASPMLSAIRARAQDTEDMQEEYEKIKPEAATLKQKPNDPEASLAWGKYYCFWKGNWKEGLPLLTKGSDAALQELAKQDLATPQEPAAQVALADGWKGVTAHEIGLPRAKLLRQAMKWYKRALPKLVDRAEQDRIGKAIQEIDRQLDGKPLPGTPDHLLGTWEVRIGDNLRSKWTFLADGRVKSTYQGGTWGTWKVDKDKRRIRVTWKDRNGQDHPDTDSLKLPLKLDKTLGQSGQEDSFKIEARKIR